MIQDAPLIGWELIFALRILNPESWILYPKPTGQTGKRAHGQTVQAPMNQTPNTKHETPNTGCHSGGFTLLEIMIAMFIFAIVISTIVITYSSLFGATGTIESNITGSGMAQSCFERLRVDLRSIYVPLPPAYQPPGFNEEPDAYGFFGETDGGGGLDRLRIGFTTLEHVPKDGGDSLGVAQVWYYLERNENDTYLLRRSDNLYPFPEFEARNTDPIVCDQIQSITLTYIDEEGVSLDTWNSESSDFEYATPRAVHVTLLMGRPDEPPRTYESRIYMPVYREPQG